VIKVPNRFLKGYSRTSRRFYRTAGVKSTARPSLVLPGPRATVHCDDDGTLCKLWLVVVVAAVRTVRKDASFFTRNHKIKIDHNLARFVSNFLQHRILSN
jgi:hypothetical protein